MRILMIAPACYPVNGAEAIVNMKLLRAFAQTEDITVDLISRNNSYIYPSDDIEKYGVKINELHLIDFATHKNVQTIWRFILSFFYFHILTSDCFWAAEALGVVKKLVERNKYDFVLTKNTPSYLLGAYLKKKGLKWVASWNDPFPGNFYPYPYGFGKNYGGNRHEVRILNRMRQADFHVFPTLLLQEHMRSYLNIPVNKCKVIPHVVLESNSNLDKKVKNGKDSDTLCIIHSGNMYGQRNPLTFFRAVENVLESNENIKINITVLGKIDEKFLPELDNLPYLKNRIIFLPPVEYQQSLAILEKYDVACVLEAPCRKGEGVFLPTKVTDFMQQGIPILAISPQEGVLHGLYKNGNIGYYGDVADIQSIEFAIKSLYDDFKDHRLKCNVIDADFLPRGVVKAYREIASNLKNSDKL